MQVPCSYQVWGYRYGIVTGYRYMYILCTLHLVVPHSTLLSILVKMSFKKQHNRKTREDSGWEESWRLTSIHSVYTLDVCGDGIK